MRIEDDANWRRVGVADRLRLLRPSGDGTRRPERATRETPVSQKSQLDRFQSSTSTGQTRQGRQGESGGGGGSQRRARGELKERGKTLVHLILSDSRRRAELERLAPPNSVRLARSLFCFLFLFFSMASQ